MLKDVLPGQVDHLPLRVRSPAPPLQAPPLQAAGAPCDVTARRREVVPASLPWRRLMTALLFPSFGVAVRSGVVSRARRGVCWGSQSDTMEEGKGDSLDGVSTERLK